ncbi:hypothetical protein, partial [Staphylococcus aureus]
HLGLQGRADLVGDGVVDYFDEIERRVGSHGILRGHEWPMVTAAVADVTPLPRNNRADRSASPV